MKVLFLLLHICTIFFGNLKKKIFIQNNNNKVTIKGKQSILC